MSVFDFQETQELTSDEKRIRDLQTKKESVCEKNNWKGSSSSVNNLTKDRISRRRTRRRKSAEQVIIYIGI